MNNIDKLDKLFLPYEKNEEKRWVVLDMNNRKSKGIHVLDKAIEEAFKLFNI